MERTTWVSIHNIQSKYTFHLSLKILQCAFLLQWSCIVITNYFVRLMWEVQRPCWSQIEYCWQGNFTPEFTLEQVRLILVLQKQREMIGTVAHATSLNAHISEVCTIRRGSSPISHSQKGHIMPNSKSRLSESFDCKIHIWIWCKLLYFEKLFNIPFAMQTLIS